VDNLSLLISSIAGIIVFSIIARYFYHYADGKANVKGSDKKEKYLRWQATHGASLKKTIKLLSIIFGVLILIQILSLV
jgi:hypothetical protein